MRMSQYETEQLLKFIDAMFPDWKCIMDRGTCRSEGFIAYLRKWESIDVYWINPNIGIMCKEFWKNILMR